LTLVFHIPSILYSHKYGDVYYTNISLHMWI
jgi:hypothetical protein